ncbi:hypothetical protein L9F63_019737 [Diploptera punctata]|uniref:Uncharacterized protein n=1 Tax=Diploptera punctata TaxID=6984 RepID=A0AAD7ZTQ4_DIPPU|nr:hypothetical protein L9F63_019737 [Diploptera punctata]
MKFLYHLRRPYVFFERKRRFPFIRFQKIPNISNARCNSRVILALFVNGKDILDESGWRDYMKFLYHLTRPYVFFERKRRFPFIRFQKIPNISNARCNSRVILALFVNGKDILDESGWRFYMKLLYHLTRPYVFFERKRRFPFIRFQKIPNISNARCNSRVILALFVNGKIF